MRNVGGLENRLDCASDRPGWALILPLLLSAQQQPPPSTSPTFQSLTRILITSLVFIFHIEDVAA